MYLDRYKELPTTNNILEIANILHLDASSDSMIYKIKKYDDECSDPNSTCSNNGKLSVTVDEIIDYLVSNMSPSVKKKWDNIVK